MKNIPKKIFLQIGDEKPSSKDDFKELEVSWCTDKINEFDIEYILRSQLESVKKELEHTITYFKDPGTNFKAGRVFECESVLEKINKILK